LDFEQDYQFLIKHIRHTFPDIDVLPGNNKM
jgi:hypothetical protein